MSDAGTKKTDREIAKIEKALDEVYSEAEKDIQDKLSTFMSKYSAKNQIKLTQLGAGEITQQEYNNWVQGQIFQKEQWENKRDQIVSVMTNTNEIATKMVNGSMYGVFAFNSNYQAYEIEKNFGVNFGFGLYDTTSVTNLLKNDPQILPKWKVNEKKDYVWNSKKVNNAITQGIIQGKKLDEIANKLTQDLCAQNKNTMKTFARTGMTQAQNAGRYQRQMDAKKLGINMAKVWMSTLDGRTRDSHRDMDGEQITVGDKWHPQKFSNGLRYPGDPAGDPSEVYNCRCTLVAELIDYPAEYERYDNIDGVPVKNMTYNEWAKAKGGVGHTTTKYTKSDKSTEVNYSKYGGKENFDIVKKYEGDYSTFITESSEEEFDKLWQQFGDINNMKKVFDESNTDIKSSEKALTTETTKAEKELQKAQNELDKLQAQVDHFDMDKKFENIWYNQTVTYADWEDKKDSIQAKKDYYNEQIEKYTADGNSDMVAKMQDKLKELEEFETHGEEYSKILKDYEEAKEKVQDLTPKPDASEVFSADAYSEDRKKNAFWAVTPKEADDQLRSATKEVWKDATKKEKYAAWDYTAGSGGFNRPLRGYAGSWYNFVGVGKVDLNYEDKEDEIKNLTELLSRSRLKQDTWLTRGVSSSGAASFLQIPDNILSSSSQEELEKLLVGKEVTDTAFMSCGSARGTGFDGIRFNIYCPEGTQAIYVEPFSRYGSGAASPNWDGVSDQNNFGYELETLLQRGGSYRVTGVNKKYGNLEIEIEVVGQDPTYP